VSVLFGNRLPAARKTDGLSLQQLAGRTEGIITKQALSQYEQNKSRPSSNILTRLARALSVPVDFLFAEPE